MRNDMAELKDLLCDELSIIAGKGELTMCDLDLAYKITSTVKNLYKIDMYEGTGEKGKTIHGRIKVEDHTNMHEKIDHIMNDASIAYEDKMALKKATEMLGLK